MAGMGWWVGSGGGGTGPCGGGHGSSRDGGMCVVVNLHRW